MHPIRSAAILTHLGYSGCFKGAKALQKLMGSAVKEDRKNLVLDGSNLIDQKER